MKHRFTPGAAPRAMNVLVDSLHAGDGRVSVPVPVDGLRDDVADLSGVSPPTCMMNVP